MYEQEAVFKAYVDALDEDPARFRSDAEAWESWVKDLSCARSQYIAAFAVPVRCCLSGSKEIYMYWELACISTHLAHEPDVWQCISASAYSGTCCGPI